MKSKWTNKWPEEEGFYWFYGYRFGKIVCGAKAEPELVMMNAYKISNGFMYVDMSGFMYESEVEEPYFQKAIIPELPKR